MKTKMLLFASFLFLAACSKEDLVHLCPTPAKYLGTAVCYDGENAAAIEVVETGEIYIIQNFFDLVDPGTFSLNQDLNIGFVDVPYEISPALCGPLIVAPLTAASCIDPE